MNKNAFNAFNASYSTMSVSVDIAAPLIVDHLKMKTYIFDESEERDHNSKQVEYAKALLSLASFFALADTIPQIQQSFIHITSLIGYMFELKTKKVFDDVRAVQRFFDRYKEDAEKMKKFGVGLDIN